MPGGSGVDTAAARRPAMSEHTSPHTPIAVGDGAAIPHKSDAGLFTAWRIAFFGAIVLCLFLAFGRPDQYMAIFMFVPDGILVTFKVTIGAILLAIVFGLIAGLGRLSTNRFINGAASLYVEIIRGIPLLVQLFYIYYALGRFVKIPDILSAIIAMAFCYGAYMAEIFRAGIQSIPKGQMEAALSLGMSRSQAMRQVILPQAFKVVLPPIGNEFIALLKDSSLVSILAVVRPAAPRSRVCLGNLQLFRDLHRHRPDLPDHDALLFQADQHHGGTTQ